MEGVSVSTGDAVAMRRNNVLVGVGVRGHNLPLSLLSGGETAIIAEVRGKGDMHHHLENLGFVEGARVTIRSMAAGDLIVEIKGTQVALNKKIAAHIITKATT